MLRICLGCLEELHAFESHHQPSDNTDVLKYDDFSGDSESSIGSSLSSGFGDAIKEKKSRIRRYASLAILSSICGASALDAAANQESQTMSWQQRYMVVAPFVVSCISTILFALCLHPFMYSVASHPLVGGILSVLLFLVWLVDLVITMHSDDSWAVNGIGEIQIANLYYFSWCSIITAGLLMMSYAESIVGRENKNEMFVIWAGNVKVCMVTLGASLHVWHGIADGCVPDFDEDLEEGNAAFCTRTRFAMAIGVTGILSGWLVMVSRILGCPIPKKFRTYVETCLSVLLILMFGVGVALVTGIGGPGQTVGDLFYSSWLSFFVSLVIFVTCIDQLQQQEIIEHVGKAESNEVSRNYITFSDDTEESTAGKNI
jgi:hypothetical protein